MQQPWPWHQYACGPLPSRSKLQPHNAYVVFMIVGDFAAYFLGLFTEYEWGSQVSLIVFLALYFLFLWVSWVLAVRVTKPETAEQQSS